ESTGCDFASRNPGMMHACGHDIHITGALGAAMILNSHKDELPGSVTFLFQPNE
ncbi:MAG: M20/M25/M40 family metallo-hydrolase, partial [Synergistaceae bacterium]|nr:M20/M25/M40 family metallo-hydrolase [Synergistaceae bacterium]